MSEGQAKLFFGIFCYKNKGKLVSTCVDQRHNRSITPLSLIMSPLRSVVEIYDSNNGNEIIREPQAFANLICRRLHHILL
jgi:dsDNA-specific endonuclease/ATPase MutS2